MLQLRVEDIKQETTDTATFYLSDVSGKQLLYLAGQFLTLIFNHHDEETRRSYSLSSSPDEKCAAITIKRVDNGEISRFMLAKVKKGDILNAVPPAGKFTLSSDAFTAINLVYFAAGSGIVPIYAQIKYLLARPGDSKVVVFYSNNNSSDILYNEELNALQNANPNRLKVVYLISNQGNRLTNVNLEALLKQHLQNGIGKAQYYMCGPFAYMRMIRLTLSFLGVESARIRKENFVLETIPVAHTSIIYPPQNIKLEFKGEVYSIAVGENQSILQAALQNDIALPYSCRAGMCSTCTAKCISGKVEMSVNDVLLEADLAEGWVLTCTGHPVSDDVVLKI
ncbi:2Fe-2S iron-sulfur cluster-binding protein [Mucilaginibacter sp. HD30]